MEKSKHLILMVGPPGSGKSSIAKKCAAEESYTYINQDEQGKEHLNLFNLAILSEKKIIVDRLNFSKMQRNRYLSLAKEHGYVTEIIVLHQPYDICLHRCLARTDHETIKDEKAAKSALNMFFTKYERPTDDEADKVTRIWPDGVKPQAIWSDLDGTLCEVEHRRHFVRRIDGKKKDWHGFFKAMIFDGVNWPVMKTLRLFSSQYEIIYCSGRPDDYKKDTLDWLDSNKAPSGPLYMRMRNDSRQDNIVKEVLLDFEILTRYELFFCLDDRDQVVNMLRNRGFKVFQVAFGDF